MEVKIYRDSTEQCQEAVLMGIFNDLYHPAVFLKAMLDESNDHHMKGRFVVEYDFTDGCGFDEVEE